MSDAAASHLHGHEHDPKLPRPAHHIGRRRLTVIVAPIGVLWVCNLVGWIIGPQLVTEAPIALMALGPSNRNVVFAANAVQNGRDAFGLYFAVGFFRLLAPDASFYLLGKLYGDRAIVWMENRTKTLGESMRSLERLFGRAGHALVVIMPNNPVCLLAGAAEMPVALFAGLNVAGTVGRMFLLYWIGDKLADPISWFLQVVKDYRPYFLAVTVGSGLLLFFSEFRKGTTEVQQLAELEDELEPEEDTA